MAAPPCGMWHWAHRGVGAPVLAGEGGCPGFGLHLGSFGVPFLRTVGEL